MLHKEKDRLEKLLSTLMLNEVKSSEQFHAIRKEINEIAEATQDPRAIGYSSMLVLEKYIFVDGDFQKAREVIMDMLDLGGKSGDVLLEAHGYLYSGTCYDMQGNNLVAFDQYWLSIRKVKMFTGDPRIKEKMLTRLHFEIAACLLSGGEYEQALYYLSTPEADQLNIYDKVVNYANKIICLYKLKRYEKAWEELLAWDEFTENLDKGEYLNFAKLIWKYILLCVQGNFDTTDALMVEILNYKFRANEAEELPYLCEYLLDNKNYDYFIKVFAQYEEFTKKLDSQIKMLDLVKLKLRYLEEIKDEESYKEECILLHQLQQEVDEQEQEQKRSSLSKYVSVMQKEEAQEELIQARDLLKRKSEYDEMTDLPNRYKLNEYCEAAFKNAVENKSTISVEILDVDFFKQFNDNYGHPEGDKCLIMIAEQIKNNIEEADLGARYGGDEFVIVRLNKIEEEIMRSMECLRQGVLDCAVPHEYSKAASVVTISQGAMNEIPKEGDNWKEFLKRADEALYEAKKISKNTVVMAPPLL